MYQKILRVFLVFAVASLLVACTEQPQATTPTPESNQVVSQVTDQASPPGDNLFRIALMWDTASLDPILALNSWAGDLMLRMSYDTLVRMRGQPWKPQGLLAESYESNSDYTEWTFHLRENAVFHDGSPVTANDVQWSWVRAFKLGGDLIARWGDAADADSAVVVDDYTIKFKLKTPFSDFVETLPWFYIINSKVAKSHAEAGDFGEEKDYAQAWLASNEAGSGPYMLESFEPNNQHVFVAVENYWFGWKNPSHMDKIIIKIMPSSSTQKLSLQKGDIDWAADLETEDFLSLKDQPGITTNLRGAGYYILHMNNQQGPTADPNVRKAIAYAFDYDSFLMTVVAEKATGLVGPNAPGYVKLDMPNYDLQKAKEYLAQSQYPNGGFEITFNYMPDVKYDQTAGLIVKEGLEKLNMGITVNLVPTEWTQAYELCKSPETAPSMQSIEWSTQYSIVQMLDERFNSKNWGSVFGCSFVKIPEIEQLLTSLRAKPDAATIEEIQNLVMDEMPMLIVDVYQYKEAFTSKLKGAEEVYPFPYPPYPQDLYYGQ